MEGESIENQEYSTYIPRYLIRINYLEAIFSKQSAYGTFAACDATCETNTLEISAHIDATHLKAVKDELHENGHVEDAIYDEHVHGIDYDDPFVRQLLVLGVNALPGDAQVEE
jgi:hypothetical protein